MSTLEPGLRGLSSRGAPEELQGSSRADAKSLGLGAVTGRHWMTFWSLLRTVQTVRTVRTVRKLEFTGDYWGLMGDTKDDS